MKKKLHWKSYIHSLRRREVEIVFSGYPRKGVDIILELGAGDGFQSTLISKYTSMLYSTDLDDCRLDLNDSPGIKYKICDAEIIDEYFSDNMFDMVFSSNMFEHLPYPEKALSAIKNILKPDGLVILIMPSVFWEILHFTLHYPIKIYRYIKKHLFLRDGDNRGVKYYDNTKSLYISNNIKLEPFKRYKLLDIIRWPKPHGISRTNFKEFISFKKTTWTNLFKKNNYQILKIKKGPVSSGYGLGLDKIRHLLERIGFTSEYIYYIKPQ